MLHLRCWQLCDLQPREEERREQWRSQDKGERLNTDDASDDAFQLPSDQVSCPYNLTLHFPCKEKDQFTSEKDFAVNNNSVTSNHFFNKEEDNRKFSFLLKLQRGNIKKKRCKQINL